MIIWINGTFGSGKTTVAYELYKRLEKAFVYDPERFGYVLMKNVPHELAEDDFQNYPLWREANYSLLKQIAQQYNGIIIVPMTITEEKYFQEIIEKLRFDSLVVNHFTLMASQKTIQKRLRKRFEGEKSWAYQQMIHRLPLLENEVYREHIQTDTLTVDEVVETIATSAGIELKEDTRSTWRKKLDRIIITIKEIGLLK